MKVLSLMVGNYRIDVESDRMTYIASAYFVERSGRTHFKGAITDYDKNGAVGKAIIRFCAKIKE